MAMPRIVRAADVVLMVCALCAAAVLGFVLWQPGGNQVTAIVTVGASQLDPIDLTQVEQGYVIRPDASPAVTIRVEPGAIYFEQADCPDKLCVAAGRLTRPGQAAVCLPARVSIRLEGRDDTVDAVVY